MFLLFDVCRNIVEYENHELYRPESTEESGDGSVGKLTRIDPVTGRVLISQLFIIGGLGKIAGWKETAASMASKGMPMVTVFLVEAILFELLCGFSIPLGLRFRIGVTVLVVYLVVVSLIFPNFWTCERNGKTSSDGNLHEKSSHNGRPVVCLRV